MLDVFKQRFNKLPGKFLAKEFKYPLRDWTQPFKFL